MTTPSQSLTCPQCGGTMDIYTIGTDRRAQCQYCRSVMDLPDLPPPPVDSEQATHQEIPYPEPDQKLAKFSLVASLAGLMGFFPIVGSLAGILAGREALKKIQQSPSLYGGEKLARAGLVMGWMGLAVNILGLCVTIGLNLLQVVFKFIAELK